MINRKILYALPLALSLYGIACFSQTPAIAPPTPSEILRIPETAPVRKGNKQPAQTVVYEPDVALQKQQQQNVFKEVEQYQRQQLEIRNEMFADVDDFRSTIHYSLPSYSNKEGAKSYVDAFNKLQGLDQDNYSVAGANFIVENAYYDNKGNEAEFAKVVRQTGDFLRAKMKELKYDENSNLAKNYLLFQFFSETMTLKATRQQHFPIKYDFNDYMGQQDWSKMFVSKLIKSGTGQCHSMPMFYLILAEEIGAEAYLAMSPNHSYIKFPDEKNKWYNLELTSGMATTNTFILNSGFIKAEAMQSKIYMQSLSKRQLLSQFYTDLASGYKHKFGFDRFVEMTVQKALELHPQNISAHLLLSNYNRERFEYVMGQLKVDPRDKKQLQKIRQYPEAVKLLQTTNKQFQVIDDLGFEPMPADAYEKWLTSLKDAKSTQENEEFRQQFKGAVKPKPRN